VPPIGVTRSTTPKKEEDKLTFSRLVSTWPTRPAWPTGDGTKRHHDNTYKGFMYEDLTYKGFTYKGFAYKGFAYKDFAYKDFTYKDFAF
jgi:hypothetical protein